MLVGGHRRRLRALSTAFRPPEGMYISSPGIRCRAWLNVSADRSGDGRN